MELCTKIAVFFVYSKDVKVKVTPTNAQRCVTAFGETFSGIAQFSQQSLFEEGNEGAHDLCGAISRKMEGVSLITNWVNIWTPLLEKIEFSVQEVQRLTLGIRLAKNPPEVHGGWKGNQLRSNTITETWAGAREVFGELWTKDTVMYSNDRYG